MQQHVSFYAPRESDKTCGGVKEGSESVSMWHQAIIKVNYCSVDVETTLKESD